MHSPTPARRPRFWRALLSVPNLLCLLRLLLVGVTWAFALAGMPRLVALGIVLAGVTDVLDGPIARWTGSTSRLGSALDSMADLSLASSTLCWLVMLRQEFVRDHLLPLAAWGVAGLVVLAVGWVRFRRIGDLHLLSAKLAGPVAYFWAVCLLLRADTDVRLFYLAMVLAFAAQAEMLVAFLTRRRVDERLGSVLPRIFGGAAPQPPRGPRDAGDAA